MHDSCNPRVEIRSASGEELPVINLVIDRAIAGWVLAARARRLISGALHYTTSDLQSMQVLLATGAGCGALAVAAWESADPKDMPNDRRTALLHGVYVDVSVQGTGIGRQLLDIASASAARQDYCNIVVRAWHQSEAFFRHLGFKQFNCKELCNTFPHRLWRAL